MNPVTYMCWTLAAMLLIVVAVLVIKQVRSAGWEEKKAAKPGAAAKSWVDQAIAEAAQVGPDEMEEDAAPEPLGPPNPPVAKEPEDPAVEPPR